MCCLIEMTRLPFYVDDEFSVRNNTSPANNIQSDTKPVFSLPTNNTSGFAASYSSFALNCNFADDTCIINSNLSYNDHFQEIELNCSSDSSSGVLDYSESPQIDLFWARYNQYPQHLKKIKKRNKRKGKK